MPTPWVVVCAGGMLNTLLFSQVLLFAPGSSEVAVGFFFFIFWSLCIFVWSWPQVHKHKFLCILLLEETCVHVQALQQRVSGPSLFHTQEGCDQEIGPSSQKETNREGGQRGGSQLPFPRLSLQDRQVQGLWQGWEGKEREKSMR